MPQGTDAAAPASRRVPAALLTLIDLGAGQTVPGVWPAGASSVCGLL